MQSQVSLNAASHCSYKGYRQTCKPKPEPQKLSRKMSEPSQKMSEQSRATKKSQSNFDQTIVIGLQNDKEKATNTIESIEVSSFFSVQLYYCIRWTAMPRWPNYLLTYLLRPVCCSPHRLNRLCFVHDYYAKFFPVKQAVFTQGTWVFRLYR